MLDSPEQSGLISLSDSQLISNLNYICNLNSPLPCDPVYLQGLGIWGRGIMLPAKPVKTYGNLEEFNFTPCTKWTF